MVVPLRLRQLTHRQTKVLQSPDNNPLEEFLYKSAPFSCKVMLSEALRQTTKLQVLLPRFIGNHCYYHHTFNANILESLQILQIVTCESNVKTGAVEHTKRAWFPGATAEGGMCRCPCPSFTQYSKLTKN